MIHILLLILKILGIVLLAVLALVLLILFFPISYKITGNLKETSYNVRVSVNWMFHLLHFGWYADKNKRQYTLRLFGIPILKYPKKEKRNKGKRNEYEETIESETIKYEESALEDKEMPEQIRRIGDKNLEESTKGSNNVLEKNSTNNMLPKEMKFCKQKENCEKKKSISDRVKRKIQKFISGIKRLFQKTQNTKDKISQIKKFLIANTTKEAYQYGKRIIIKILKHISPRKIIGNLHFGFESPDMTGKTLGYIAMAFGTFHINPRKMRIEPDFERKIIEGNLKMKGHLMLGVVGIDLLRFYLKKEVKYIIKKFS